MLSSRTYDIITVSLSFIGGMVRKIHKLPVLARGGFFVVKNINKQSYSPTFGAWLGKTGPQTM